MLLSLRSVQSNALPDLGDGDRRTLHCVASDSFTLQKRHPLHTACLGGEVSWFTRGPFRWIFESAAADLRLPKAPVWLSQHPTRATRRSRVYSSTTTRVRTGCPSCVGLRTNSLESILSAESRRSIWTRFRGQGHSGVYGHCPSTSSNTSPAAPEGGRVPIAVASVIATSTV